MDYIDLISKLLPTVALIIGGFAYFIKRRYDLLSKKIEMKYGLFQQNKFDAIKDYFNSYAVFERALSNISTYRIADQSYTVRELDEMTALKLNNLISSDLYLNLFLEKKELDKFNSITKKIINVHGGFSDAYFNGDRENTTLVGNDLFFLLKDAREKNALLLKEIGTELNEGYNKDTSEEIRFFSTRVRRNKR